MLEFRCIGRLRNKSGDIIGYKLVNENGDVSVFKADEVKKALKVGSIRVVNMKLTSDNRIFTDFSKAQKPKMSKKTTLVLDTLGWKLYPYEIYQDYSSHNFYVLHKSDYEHVVYLPDDVDNIVMKSVVIKNRVNEVIRSLLGKLMLVGGSGLKDITALFRQVTLDSIDLSTFDTSNVENMSYLFDSCKTHNVNINKLKTNRVKNMMAMFRGYDVRYIKFDRFDTSNVENMSGMFLNSRSKSINLSKLDTSKVTNMYGMFKGCRASIIELNGIDTSHVRDMHRMFEGCKTGVLNLSSLDTHNVFDMSYMFADSRSKIIDVSNFDTSIVTNMSYMFKNVDVSQLDVSKFKTSKLMDMEGMFYGCKAYAVDITKFDTRNVENMARMFERCMIEHIDISKLDTRNVINMKCMFKCSGVIGINVKLDWLDMGKVEVADEMFYGCTLYNLDISKLNINISVDMSKVFYGCNVPFNLSVGMNKV